MFNQDIYFGAPGTGKSYEVSKILEKVPEDQIFRTVIHPEYTYSNFIGQLLPYKDEMGTGFKFFPGVLTQALKAAYADNSKDVYLVLEELSRGNVAAIFGDVFQLLDRDHKFESEYPIRNELILNEIPQIESDLLKFPTNFNILCTVNTNDQSVFPMDNAFKRRFNWYYIDTTPAKNSDGKIDTKLNNPKIEIVGYDNKKIEIGWLSFYTALNLYITNKDQGLGLNEDKQLGQFFLRFNDEDVASSNDSRSKDYQESIERVKMKIKNKLLLYLWQDIENASAFRQKSLFSNTINSFDDLYTLFENEQVFSSEFINNFLIMNISKYEY